MPDIARRIVGRYEILRELGRDDVSTVHLARRTDLNRCVALRALHPRGAWDPASAGALSHPNIVPVFDCFEHDGTRYIATEYLERGSLRPHVGRMTLPQIGGVLEGLLAAVGHAEARGVVHGDLKPENVLVKGDGRVKIAGFGLVQAERGPDLHSVGRIASELFAGEGIDPQLSHWIERLLAGRTERAGDAGVMLEEILLRLCGPLWRRAAPLGEPAVPAVRARRGWAFGVATAAAIAALTGVAASALGTDRRDRREPGPVTLVGHGIALDAPAGRHRDPAAVGIVARDPGFVYSASLQLTSGKALPIGPDAAFIKRVGRVLGWLEARERPVAARLQRATTRADRLAATKQLWWTYAGASKRLRRLDAGPADRMLRRQLAEALRLAGCAYGRAAGHRDRAGYEREGELALVHQVGVRRALDGLLDAGYELPANAVAAARFTPLQ